MNWRFWKRKPEVEAAVIRTGLPIATLFHWYCYDLDIPDPKDLANSLGLSPVSDDVAKMEQDASQRRVSRLIPMLSFLHVMSELNGTVAATRQTDFLKAQMSLSDEQTEAMVAHMQETFSIVSLSALISAFSAALELGFVAPDRTVSQNIIERSTDEFI